MKVQPNEPPLESLVGLNHGSRFRDPKDSFNTTPQPNWSKPRRTSEQTEYADIHRLIEKSRKEID